MPVVNPLARELVFKVVYYGPGLGGKTTSLQYLHATAKPEHRGKLVSLATPVDRTLYFDFLPIRVPNVRGMNVRLQLFTVPGQVYYNATRKLVLTGADGIVAVFDSQRARFDANQESLENLIENLRAHGRELAEVPHIIQYNKRDLYDVAPIDELERQLNRMNAPSFATTATNGEGIYEALEAITRAVLEDFERRMPDTRGLPSAQLELPEGGLVDALRRAESGTVDFNLTRTRTHTAQAQGPATQTSAALSSSHGSAVSSLSGEHRLSTLPEVDPGEAAARSVSGQADELIPRPRQTWPLPGAPDEARYSTSVERTVASPLKTTGNTVSLGGPNGPMSGHLAPPTSQVMSVVQPPPPAPEPRPAIVPEPTSAPVQVVMPERTTQPEAAPLPAPLPVAPVSPAVAEPSAPSAPSTINTDDIGPSSMREPPRKPRTIPPVAMPPEAPTGVSAGLPAPTGLSFEQLWPSTERSMVRELETSYANGNYTRVITLSEQLVARSLAGAAAALGGTPDAPRDPLTIVLVLGVDRRRYLEYRGLVRDARSGRTMSPSEALVAYALAIETRLSRISLTG